MKIWWLWIYIIIYYVCVNKVIIILILNHRLIRTPFCAYSFSLQYTQFYSFLVYILFFSVDYCFVLKVFLCYKRFCAEHLRILIFTLNAFVKPIDFHFSSKCFNTEAIKMKDRFYLDFKSWLIISIFNIIHSKNSQLVYGFLDFGY